MPSLSTTTTELEGRRGKKGTAGGKQMNLHVKLLKSVEASRIRKGRQWLDQGMMFVD